MKLRNNKILVTILVGCFTPMAAYSAEGKELILSNVSGPGQFGYNQVYIAGGTNTISDEDWKSYVPDFGYTKNSTRAVVFGGNGFLSSPGYPPGTFVYYTDTKGYTWLWNTQNRMAIYPFDQSLYPGLTIFQAGGTGSCPPGSLQVFANWKNHPMTFSANGTKYHFIKDQYGNEYILGAYNQSYTTPESVQNQFDSVVLPAGWTKDSHTLATDLTISPTTGSTGGNYEYEFNQLRDANQNNYFQYIFSTSGDSIFQNIPSMAIYAGTGNERINGTKWPDFIHGGQGNDDLYGYQDNDNIYGDDGLDKLRGGDGNDYLFGGIDNDYLDGQLGKDALTGGAGGDQFLFTTPGFGNNLADMIVDFNNGEGDTIGLSSNIFTKGLTLKTVSTGRINSYSKNSEAFLYDKKTGRLYYNANGKETGWGESGGYFVKLAGAPVLSTSDLKLMSSKGTHK
jgi:Ca2+-binding RTX toxin-like protein